MRRGVILAIGGLTLVGASVGTASCVAGLRHDYRQWKASRRVQPGMSADQVKRILGEPLWHDRCGAKFRYQRKAGCDAEFGYPSAFAPLPPTYLIVQLDNRERAISVDTVDVF